MAAPPVNEECRAQTENWRKERKAEYRQISRIKRKLERRKNVPVFDEARLAGVFAVQGAPLDIDHDDSIDLDLRFFLPGPVDEMEHALESIDIPWMKMRPLEYHKLQMNGRGESKVLAYDIVNEAYSRAGFCERAARDRSGWQSYM